MKFSTSPVSKVILFIWFGLSVSLISPPGDGRAQGNDDATKADSYNFFVPAPWLNQPHATPIDRYYGLAHTQDTGFYPKITVDWEKLGMAGAQTSVDSNAPPYAGSHRLISSRPMPTGVGPHNGVVMDNGPTTTNGSPVYEEVWRYLIGS